MEPTSEQRHIMDICSNGVSVLVWGAAGTGKSYLMHQITAEAEASGKRVLTTAWTGSAASLVNGMTLSSLFGLGRMEKQDEQYVRAIMQNNSPLAARLRETDILIVDEAYMISVRIFELICRLCHAARTSKKEMEARDKMEADDGDLILNPRLGGMQLILCGDPLQMGPIAERGSSGRERNPFFYSTDLPYVIDRSCIFRLTVSMRHKDASEFSMLLDRLGRGQMTSEDRQRLQERVVALPPNMEQIPHLYSRVADARNRNETMYDRLDSPYRVYKAKDTYIQDKRYSEKPSPAILQDAMKRLDKVSQVPDDSVFKCGCQVYLTHNLAIESHWINGTSAIVLGCGKESVLICRDIVSAQRFLGIYATTASHLQQKSGTGAPPTTTIAPALVEGPIETAVTPHHTEPSHSTIDIPQETAYTTETVDSPELLRKRRCLERMRLHLKQYSPRKSPASADGENPCPGADSPSDPRLPGYIHSYTWAPERVYEEPLSEDMITVRIPSPAELHAFVQEHSVDCLQAKCDTVCERVTIPYFGEVVRYAVPLMLGWGISIHRSQGMELSPLRINLSGLFAPNQGYVALSRCRSLEQLYLIGCIPNQFLVADFTHAWYQQYTTE